MLLRYSNIYPTRCNVTQSISSGSCSTCFGWYHHPSSRAQTTVSTASGICHTVTAICCCRGRVGTGLSLLWVAPLTHTQTGSTSSTIAADSSNCVINTRCCRYSCLRSWWWVMVLPEECRAACRWNRLCNVASNLVVYILEYYYNARSHER
jgi:hypothetical protein